MILVNQSDIYPEILRKFKENIIWRKIIKDGEDERVQNVSFQRQQNMENCED